MNTSLNEVVVHLNESVDDATWDALERDIHQDQGVVSACRRPEQKHLMIVIYDAELAPASSILRNFSKRGLHAQLVGM